MTILELLGSVGVIMALIAIVIWKCAEVDFLWTFLPRNQVKAWDRGRGNPAVILGATPNPIQRWVGIYWVGLPPLEIHQFPLVHRRVNPEMKAETPSDQWMVRDKEALKTGYLLREVVHQTLLMGVEFKGGQKADILLEYTAIVDGEEGARIAIYDRDGKFYDILDGVIETSATSSHQMRDLTYEKFMAEDKDAPKVGDDEHMMAKLLVTVNETAPKMSGYKLGTIYVRKYDASSTAEEKLARLRTEATIKMEAAKILAEGKVADATQLAAGLKIKLPNASDDAIADAVRQIIVATRYAESEHLQAVGGGAVVGLQPEGNRGGGNRRRKK